MNKQICNVCKTENENKYTYCKNCGALLEKNQQETTSGTENQNNTYNQNTYSYQPNNSYDTIDGIPYEDISAFVGKKSNDYIMKFKKMEITNSKASWNWPLAILGFLFGPFGVSLWFYYRKMYKPAIILSILGTFVALIVSVLNAFTSGINFNAIFDILFSGDFSGAIHMLNNATPKDTILNLVSSLFNDLSSIGCCIIFGIFGNLIYKKHTILKINEYKNSLADPRYYKIGLSAIGGVSGGMSFIGILIWIISTNIISYATAIINTIF